MHPRKSRISEKLKKRLLEEGARKASLEEALWLAVQEEKALESEARSADVTIGAYKALAGVIDRLKAEGRREELKTLLGYTIKRVLWKPTRKNPQEGEALIELFPLPGELPSETEGSFSRPKWRAM